MSAAGGVVIPLGEIVPACEKQYEFSVEILTAGPGDRRITQMHQWCEAQWGGKSQRAITDQGWVCDFDGEWDVVGSVFYFKTSTGQSLFRFSFEDELDRARTC